VPRHHGLLLKIFPAAATNIATELQRNSLDNARKASERATRPEPFGEDKRAPGPDPDLKCRIRSPISSRSRVTIHYIHANSRSHVLKTGPKTSHWSLIGAFKPKSRSQVLKRGPKTSQSILIRLVKPESRSYVLKQVLKPLNQFSLVRFRGEET
jgi:hypothetical protein